MDPQSCQMAGVDGGPCPDVLNKGFFLQTVWPAFSQTALLVVGGCFRKGPPKKRGPSFGATAMVYQGILFALVERGVLRAIGHRDVDGVAQRSIAHILARTLKNYLKSPIQPRAVGESGPENLETSAPKVPPNRFVCGR